jgi:predicted nucleic acid-binding protein
VILVDTSVWVNHLRVANEVLSTLMARKETVTHPFVIGEVALGSIARRSVVLAELQKLPSVQVARDRDVMLLVERHRLFGTGIGYVDVHLLAAALFADGLTLWTQDRRLLAVAIRLGIAAHPLN